jgi:hypothetical protein
LVDTDKDGNKTKSYYDDGILGVSTIIPSKEGTGNDI